MLQQTVIKAVLPVYARFMKRFPTAAALAAAPTEAVREAVRGLGYYRRFNFLHLASQQILRNGGDWPKTATAWQDLPGVGEYTAAAIASITLGETIAVVDGNVERVMCRLFDLRQPPNLPMLKKAFKQFLSTVITSAPASKQPGDFNQGLMELGQTVCTPQNPKCADCPVKNFCLANERQSQDLAPAPKARPEITDVVASLTIWRDKNRVALVERKPNERFLRGSWGFPMAINVTAGNYSDSDCSILWRGKIRHMITHHRIAADVVVRRADKSIIKNTDLRWVAIHDAEKSLVANLDRKALLAYLKIAPTTPQGAM